MWCADSVFGRMRTGTDVYLYYIEPRYFSIIMVKFCGAQLMYIIFLALLVYYGVEKLLVFGWLTDRPSTINNAKRFLNPHIDIFVDQE